MIIGRTLEQAKARRVTGGKENEVARRRYQTGSLFKRGRRRKVWVARWREDVIQPDGSRGRLQRSVVLGLVSEIPTRRQAQSLLGEKLRPLNQGLIGPQSTMRLRDYVQGEWERLVLPTLKLSTQHGYRVLVRRHLVPYFGESRLCDITKLDIQQFVAEKFRHELAWQTVRNAWIVLSSILDAATEYGHLTVNPARGVKFPPQPPRREPVILTADALNRLLSQLDQPFSTMVALVALSGLRIGELLALRWRVVDFGGGTLRVRESVFLDKFQTPKSDEGTRTLPLGPIACELLKRHRQRSVQTAPEDLVFPAPKGGPYKESNLLQEVLQPAAAAAGLGHVTWHQLRHVHSSVLHDLGVPVKVIQQQLGHAAVETTLNIYTHVVGETQRKAIEDLERVLFPNVPKFD